MKIRTAADGDLLEVMFLFLREYRETRAAEAGIEIKHADILQKFIWMLKQPEFGAFLVAEAEEDGAIVGYIYGPYRKGWDGNDDIVVWHEVGWYVKKDSRGQGIGLALFKAAEDIVVQAKMASHMTVTTAVGSDHEKLMSKFEAAGFTPLQINFFKKVRET